MLRIRKEAEGAKAISALREPITQKTGDRRQNSELPNDER
jgi:hypothetical protein